MISRRAIASEKTLTISKLFEIHDFPLSRHGKKTLTTPKDLKLLVLHVWQKNSYNSKGFKITSFPCFGKTLTTPKDLKLLVLLSWQKNSYNLKAI
jgi:predicted amino acid racemase